MSAEDDSEIPESGAVFTFGKSKFAENIPNKFWVRNDKVVHIACGDEHTALVAESGRIFTFGINDWGQLGLGHTKTLNKPSCIKSLKHEKVRHVACGRSHTVVATESGHLYTFGNNGENQLGVDDMPGSNDPKCINSLPELQYKMLSAGADHSVALTDAGHVYVWGNGSEGQLGLGDKTECLKPMQLEFDKTVKCIACGYYHTALVTDDGELYIFGEHDGGKLGLGEEPDETNTPQHVSFIHDRVSWVACGGSHTVAITEKGDAYTFGCGSNGQLGQGTQLLQVQTPQKLNSIDGRVKFASCGENHTALVTEKGELYTFGDGRHGKLALGMDSFANQFKPCMVSRFQKLFVEKVACGGCHMLAMAHIRLENGEIDEESSDDEIGQGDGDRLDALKDGSIKGRAIQTMKTDESLELSGSARDRRRAHVSPLEASLNRTLPALSSSKGLSSLNGTLPNLTSQKIVVEDTLSKSLVPGIRPSIDEVAPVKALPRAAVKTSPWPEVETLESDDEDDDESDESEDEQRKEVEETLITKSTSNHVDSAPKPKPRLQPQPRTAQDGLPVQKAESKEESEEEEDDEVEEVAHSVPMPLPRQRKLPDPLEKKTSKSESEEESEAEELDEKVDNKIADEEVKTKKTSEEEIEEKKKGKKATKTSLLGGIFGKKKVQLSDDEKDEDDDDKDEEINDKESEKKKGEMTDNKSKDDNNKINDKKNKALIKSKNKKEAKKKKMKKNKENGEEENDDEDDGDDDENEEKDGKKGPKKKGNVKKESKQKGKKKSKTEDDEDDEEGDDDDKKKKKKDKDKGKKDKEKKDSSSELRDEENEDEKKSDTEQTEKKSPEVAKVEEKPKKSRTCTLL